MGRIWYYIESGHEPARRKKQTEGTTRSRETTAIMGQICAGRLMQNNDGPNGRIKGNAIVAANTMKDEVLQELHDRWDIKA